MADIFSMFSEQPAHGENSNSYISSSASASIDSSRTYVVSVGGSVFIDSKLNLPLIGRLAETINKLSNEGNKFVLVVGGGAIAREYMGAAKALGANNFTQDQLGIMVTRANAKVIISAIQNAHNEPLDKIEKVSAVLADGKIPVFGGLMPGFTTDAVAALVAEFLGAKFVNLSNVDGIYSANPKEHSGARLYKTLNYDNLITMIKMEASKPGQNVILDLPCCLILKRSSIPAFVMDGRNFENFESFIRGSDWHGTTIIQK